MKNGTVHINNITKLMLQPLNAEGDFHKPVLTEFSEIPWIQRGRIESFSVEVYTVLLRVLVKS